MKIATKIAGFLMSCLTLCTALQPVAAMAENTEMARPRSTIDLSRKDRLTGAPTPQDNPSYCPSGQVLSGGVCVLISNQAVTIPSGAMCGSATSMIQGEGDQIELIPRTDCQGRSLKNGCPTGFLMQVLYIDRNGGSSFLSCVKT